MCQQHLCPHLEAKLFLSSHSTDFPLAPKLQKTSKLRAPEVFSTLGMIFLHKEKKKKNPQELNTPTPSLFLLSASSQQNFQRNFLTSESYESLYLASAKLQKNTPNAPNSLGSKAPISSKLSKNKIKGRNHKQPTNLCRLPSRNSCKNSRMHRKH